MIYLIFFLILIISFLLYFYRDPERKIPAGNNIISPADGKIVQITKDKTHHKIAIFMNLHDVHVQRVPISGTITKIKKISGKNLPAYLSESAHNKCVETTIKTSIGLVVVRQLTGVFVRRISTFVKKGAVVKKGQRLGRIAFGSRVEIFLPANKVKIKVKKDDIVFAGCSIVASIK